jgi:superfamily II DNA or RNA helicase
VIAVPEVFDTLRADWLPTLKAEDLIGLASLVQLSLTGPNRTATLKTKEQALTFLRARRRTKNLQTNLRQAFVSSHKVERDAGSATVMVERPYAEPIDLAGTSAEPREAYDHQRKAWDALDELTASSGRRAGLLVLPTGSGKTFTMVHWLLLQMQRDPQLRVLWLADQQELLEQAARAFERGAQELPPEFSRVLRVLHGQAGPVTALGDRTLDVACVTRQSVVGKSPEAMAKRLEAFLARPTVVVVDEAHHAVATSYQRLLNEVERIAPKTMMLGLTATPWPSGQGAIKRLTKRFPTTVAEVDVPSLVHAGILARPTIHTVSTGESFTLDPEDVASLRSGDFPGDVLGELDRATRNTLIVDKWTSAPATWGKTLVFVGTIDHADHLGAAFTAADVPVQVLHSESGRREEVLGEFRRKSGPRVLVSVGMLLEGVDLPDARTAMLARPTRSHVLLRQMVGRVLRGPRAGGDDLAHIVAFEDHWIDGIDVLSPVDLRELGTDDSYVERPDGELKLPPIRDEKTHKPIPEDLLRRVQQAYDELAVGPTYTPGEAVLVGYYQCLEVTVPVFDHAQATWAELVDAKVAGRPTATHSARDLFGDLPVPRPTIYDVNSVTDYIASTEETPPFVAITATFSVRGAAQRLYDAPAMTQAARVDWERAEYETTLARTVYPSQQAFSEALHHELAGISPGSTTGTNPEAPRPPSSVRKREKLRAASTRELAPLVAAVLEDGWSLLDQAGEHEYADILAYPPRVSWTRTPVKTTYAYWIPRISGKAKGQAEIRVNKALQAPAVQVPDDLLEFLLWHEHCHHVLPGHGHDAEFNRLLHLWPESARLDNDIDQLAERYDLGM